MHSPREEAAWKRLDRIDGWDWVKARIWRLLTDLPPFGGLELPRLERAVRDGDATLRRMRVELSGKWRAPLCRRRRRDVPRTNNAAERATGGSEIKYKTIRRYNRHDWMLNGFRLTQRAWSGRDGLDMSELVAAQRRAVFWGICVLRNPLQNPNRFWDGYAANWGREEREGRQAQIRKPPSADL